MRLVFAVAFLLLVAMPTESQQGFNLSRDGNGMLEACTHLLNGFDSPTLETTGSMVEYSHNTFKQGWCASHIQTMREMVVYDQLQVAKTVAVLSGEKDPSVEELKAMVSGSAELTCIPDEVKIEQLTRVLVKWLRDNPARLHEPASILTVEAFHAGFACHETKSPVKQSPN